MLGVGETREEDTVQCPRQTMMLPRMSISEHGDNQDGGQERKADGWVRQRDTKTWSKELLTENKT